MCSGIFRGGEGGGGGGGGVPGPVPHSSSDPPPPPHPAVCLEVVISKGACDHLILLDLHAPAHRNW